MLPGDSSVAAGMEGEGGACHLRQARGLPADAG